jgi:hypothetical protein
MKQYGYLFLTLFIALSGCRSGTRVHRAVSVPDSEGIPVHKAINDVRISHDEAINIAIDTFKKETGANNWLNRENMSSLLIRQNEVMFWSIFWKANPIAGGGGSMLINADTGEVRNLNIPGRQR